MDDIKRKRVERVSREIKNQLRILDLIIYNLDEDAESKTTLEYSAAVIYDELAVIDTIVKT